MSYYCYPCDRSFSAQRGYEQHMENSAAHYEQSESEEEYEQWECNFCDYCFATERDCDRHMQTHNVRWECHDCDRSFTTERAYDQHIQTSAAHGEGDQWECEACDRYFASQQSLHQHCSSAENHPYCIPCKRMFISEHNLNQHLRSRLHQGSNVECPFCKNSYTTASGLTIHLESASCSSGIDRLQINDIVRRMDRNNVITRPMLTMPGYERGSEMIASERSWNGQAYECYLCDREFRALHHLNQHLKSPAHEQNIYHCPNGSCGRNYKVLSGLVMHVESESCGIMRFHQVQEQARGGIGNMVGRMISL